MDDTQIIDLFFSRSENAIKATESKYGQYCKTIAYNILRDINDSEECVNDTYLQTWNSIPPIRPNNFKAFLARITRNLSLNKLKHNYKTLILFYNFIRKLYHILAEYKTKLF